MAAWRWGVASLLVVCPVAAVAQRAEPPEAAAQRADANRVLGQWTSNELRPFRNDADFAAYQAALRKAVRAEDEWSVAPVLRTIPAILNQSQPKQDLQAEVPPPCTEPEKLCAYRMLTGGEETLTVTGSRIRTPPLTNNQEQGVDEGDVVKQIGQYLLVLQDGRIFVIDTEAGPQRNALRLADRADVYRDPEEDGWYDELIVDGDRIVVTGYIYEADASELAIFRLGEGGRLIREDVFRIQSEDYYDRNNYASRLIGDQLILYTPVPVDENRYEDGPPAPFRWPTLTRTGATGAEETQLLRPDEVYRPLSTLHDPAIHMITRCQLGSYRPGGGLACTSEGFVASRSRQFYVAGQNAYLWSYANDRLAWEDDTPECAIAARPRRSEVDQALVHRVNLSGGGGVAVAGAAGAPFDQLAMDAGGGQFRALVGWLTPRCRPTKSVPLSYVAIPDGAFGTRLRPVPDSVFTPMPDIGATNIAQRFTDRHLVFGGRAGEFSFERSAPEDDDGLVGGGDAVVVPLDRPQDARRIALPHRVWRVERIGDNAALTGYAGDRGLDVSVIDLSGATPRLSDTVRLEGRAETEGRSHAFNSLIGADGSGLMGLPTVQRIGGTDRYAWRSAASDLSFLSVDTAGRLQSLGALATHARGNDRRRWYADDDVPADPAIYSCQVSCIDWYGNSRPLFTRGRVFALTATELVEGRVADGRIAEVQRIDLTKELPEHLRVPRPGAAEEAAAPKE